MTEKKPENQRITEILDAAARCFSEKGYDRTTMDDIVKESGLTKGGIYWHFKSKRDIFVTLFDRHLAEDSANLEREFSATDSIVEFLFAQASEQFAEHSKISWFMPLTSEMLAEGYRDPILHEKVTSMFRTGADLIVHLLDMAAARGEIPKRDYSGIAYSCLATAFGLSMMQSYLSSSVPFDTIWKEYTESLIGSLSISSSKKESHS